MKQVDKKKIIDAAFHIFVRDKIESAKMSEIHRLQASEGLHCSAIIRANWNW